MERILILLGSYGVIPDAIAVCADRVAAALFEEGAFLPICCIFAAAQCCPGNRPAPASA